MKIEKRGKSYRVKMQSNGKRHSLTFDHRPTLAEVSEELSKKQKSKAKTGSMTFRTASEEYVNLKRNVLSPASVREYERMCNRLPSWFVEMPISKIDTEIMQRLINEMAKTLSPKTVKDRHAFCSGAIKLFYPSISFETTLPSEKNKEEPYIPTHDDIKAIIEAAEGTHYHIAVQLACYGLRRGEICALTVEDLDDDNFITINKAKKQNNKKEWIIDYTKTETSGRVIPIDAELAKEIRAIKKGPVFIGYPETILTFITRTQKKLGMPHFSLHKCRHYFCSTLAENNVPEADILKLGGWKTDSVMKNVYRHSNIARDKERAKTAMLNIQKNIKSS